VPAGKGNILGGMAGPLSRYSLVSEDRYNSSVKERKDSWRTSLQQNIQFTTSVLGGPDRKSGSPKVSKGEHRATTV